MKPRVEGRTVGNRVEAEEVASRGEELLRERERMVDSGRGIGGKGQHFRGREYEGRINKRGEPLHEMSQETVPIWHGYFLKLCTKQSPSI